MPIPVFDMTGAAQRPMGGDMALNQQPQRAALAQMMTPQVGAQNLARFKNAEFDRVYERMAEIADGPERDELFLQAKKIGTAYMPYKFLVHRISSDLTQP